MSSSARSVAVLLLVLGATLLWMGCADDGDNDVDSGPCRGATCADTGDGADTTPSGDVGSTACATAVDCGPSEVCAEGVCTPACQSDAECGPTSVCADGRCVPAPRCTADVDCPNGGACDTCVGVCRDGGGIACDADANCGFDEFCDECTHRCAARLGLCDPCADDRQCGDAGDLCLDYRDGGRYCGAACGGCPVGYSCDATVAQCVPVTGDCAQVRECETPADCPVGQTCSATFVCVPGCSDDASCSGELLCDRGACVPPCTSSAECDADGTCEDGRCVVPGGCLGSEDCAEPATYCDRATQQCVDGCEVDVDCQDASQECVDGACVEAGCRGNYSCAFGQVCEGSTGACVDAVGPYCDQCDGQDVDSCGAANACVTFQDDAGADAGAFCLVACVEGAGDNACPQGYGCRELDVDGDVRRVCSRQCPREPI